MAHGVQLLEVDRLIVPGRFRKLDQMRARPHDEQPRRGQAEVGVPQFLGIAVGHLEGLDERLASTPDDLDDEEVAPQHGADRCGQ